MNIPNVVSLGVHIVDILGRPVSSIPEGGGVTLIDEIRITVAGTAAGTSIDMSKLGAKVTAMGAIGQDGLGDFLVETMQKYGISTENLVRKPGVQTSATILPIRPNGERPALHTLGANAQLTFSDLNLEAIQQADYLHVGGACLLPQFEGEPMAKVLKIAQESGVITFFDIIGIARDDLKKIIDVCLPYIDFFMPGLEEASMITGLNDEDEIIHYFINCGVKHVVFKDGANGSILAYRNGNEIKKFKIPAFKAPVVDSTGCGDSYCAGFIVGHSMGWELEKCSRLGAACGGLVVQGLGSDAGIVDLDSTIRFMESAEILEPVLSV